MSKNNIDKKLSKIMDDLKELLSKDTSVPEADNCMRLLDITKMLCSRCKVPMVAIIYRQETKKSEPYTNRVVLPEEVALQLTDNKITPTAWFVAGLPASAVANEELVIDSYEKMCDVFVE